ncbi:MAG: tetratricopeptide repeat protein [Candidatus Hodarchaeota archaeon]
MSDPRTEELKRAQQLLDEDRYQETLDVLTKFENRDGITTEDRIESLLIKAKLHFHLWQHEQTLTILEEAFQLSKNQENSLQTFDILFLKGLSMILQEEDIDEIHLILNQLENVCLTFNDVSSTEQMKRKANLNRIKGIVSFRIECDYKNALDFHNRCLAIYKKLDNKADIAETVYIIAWVYFNKGDLKESLKYAKQSLTFKEIRKRDKCKVFFTLSAISYARGELVQAQEYNEQLKKISNEINNKYLSLTAIFNSGFISRLKGDLDQAIEYFKKNLIISDESGLLLNLPAGYFNIIRIYIDMGSYEEAKKYLINFRQFVDQANNRQAERMYLLTNGLVLKASPNLRDRFKAEMILKDFIEAKSPEVQYIFTNEVHYIATGIAHLCDLLLMELRRTNDLNILDELNPLITRFSRIAEDQESFWRLAHAKILQAKLSLIQMNMGEARKLLTEAQIIAEEHDLGILAQKISSEHDTLLNQLSKWEKLKEDNAPVSERINLSSFDDVIERLLEKRTVEPQNVIDEDPVILLIIAEGGVLLFSYPFTEEWERDNEIFGSFLSAISSFSKDFLSQGLDRVKFSQYTVIMEPITNFSVYYVFKGQSYLAKQKLLQFTTLIRDEVSIVDSLNKFYKASQVIELRDFPFLEAFVKRSFITKK